MTKKRPTFKPYNQHQVLLLPPSLSDLVPTPLAVFCGNCNPPPPFPFLKKVFTELKKAASD